VLFLSLDLDLILVGSFSVVLFYNNPWGTNKGVRF